MYYILRIVLVWEHLIQVLLLTAIQAFSPDEVECPDKLHPHIMSREYWVRIDYIGSIFGQSSPTCAIFQKKFNALSSINGNVAADLISHHNLVRVLL